MKKRVFLFVAILLLTLPVIFAEDKAPGSIIPKLTAEETKDGPILFDSSIYPEWGVPCTNFTYKVYYKDSKGRPPEYVRINLNSVWRDMAKERTYQNGDLYVYYNVPTSAKPNFYYFEASNGAGKARAGIIDSPDMGPALYSEKFDNNQIIFLDKDGNELWAYDAKKDMVEGIAISKDSNYIAAVTNNYIHLFFRDSNKPLWSFCTNCRQPLVSMGTYSGIAVSAHGDYIAANLQNTLYFFSKDSNKPLWTKNIEAGAVGIDMSDDGSLIAVGVVNTGGGGDKFFLFNKAGEKITEYRAEHPGYAQTGNFYRPAMTPDGKYTAVSTGCPDRRAYLFSGNGNLLFRSDQLTYDSPVHKSAISDDGALIAYSADNMQNKDIVFLFDNSGKQLWTFASTDDSTARAISMSADGQYIAAGTSAGHIYLFSKDSNTPLWKFTDSGQFGEVKLNPDGGLLAAAGTSKKIYLFSRESNKPLWSYNANTWLTRLDFNGEDIVAGTGLREYIGEGGNSDDKDIVCTEITQPPSMKELEEYLASGDEKTSSQEQPSQLNAVCGDGMCIPSVENSENCPKDCSEGITKPRRVDKISNEPGEKGFMQRIIDFFKNLFRE